MEKIIKYRAKDNREFYDLDKCMEHEVLLIKIDNILEKLVPASDDIEFTNGEGYIQQERDIVKQAIKESTELYNKSRKEMSKKIETIMYYGRLLQDSGSPLYNLYSRFDCIDTKMREWGQPYFAYHPEKGKQIEYNTKT